MNAFSARKILQAGVLGAALELFAPGVARAQQSVVSVSEFLPSNTTANSGNRSDTGRTGPNSGNRSDAEDDLFGNNGTIAGGNRSLPPAANLTALMPPSARVPIYYNGWASVAVGKMQIVRYLAWLGNQFVVAGAGPILTSADGIKWTEHKLPRGVQLQSIALYQNLYVGVGEDGVIVTSPDLNHWTLVESGKQTGFFRCTGRGRALWRWGITGRSRRRRTG